MKTICIVGGGNLGHVISGYLSSFQKAEVNILTGQPDRWSHNIELHIEKDEIHYGTIHKISSNASSVIPDSDIVLFTVPGYLNREYLQAVKPFLKPDTFVGCVFASSGFFNDALTILCNSQPIFGFRRVPFISRICEYGKSASLLGRRPLNHISIEHSDRKNEFAELMETYFDTPLQIMNNYLEVSISNSNPLLHTSRLYSMFKDWTSGKTYPRNYLFYEEWNNEASKLLIDMDRELFELIDKLPVSKGFLPTILDYYDSHDAESLTSKISSIESFKGIKSPMKEYNGRWVPNFNSRYFSEDFPYGLKIIYELTLKYGIDAPCIKKVFQWGQQVSV